MENRTNFLSNRSFLKVDNTILNKASEITMAINNKYGKDVSTEDVLIMMESIFRSVPVAVKKGEVVKVPYLGKFGIKPKRYRYLDNEVKEEINRVHSIPNDVALQEIISFNSAY